VIRTSKNLLLTLAFFLVFPGLICGQNYYLDDGGAGLNIIVIRPTGESVASEDEFVLDYIQNLIIANFKKYTAVKASGGISVSNIGKNETALLLIGTLSRTGNSYIMDLAVTDPSSGRRRASHRATNVRPADILSAQAINNGFMDVLKQINVNLSDAGIAALKNPSRDEVQAAISMARGTMAEKNNNPIEMLTYLYNAAAYDPGLLEATNRFDDYSKVLSSGNVGGSVINDLQNREKWKSILDEFDNFYRAHPPFILNFNPLPGQKGNTDYDNRTVIMEFEANFQEDISFNAMQKVFVSIATGLKNTKNQEVWGFITRPYRSPLFGGFRYYTVKAELVNERDEVAATSVFRVRSRIALLRNSLYADTTQKLKPSFTPIHIDTQLTDVMIVRIVSIDDIETEKAMQGGYVKIVPVETLPKAKARNLLALITRGISNN